MSGAELYQQYVTKMQQIADVKYASAVLQWDQETYLPPKGAPMRGRQIATLNELAHSQFANDKMGTLLQQLLSKNELSDAERVNVLLTQYDYERAQKFTSSFVRTMSETVNESFHAWVQARKQNSFATFEKPLHKLIELKKQEADILGYANHPYNALMNDYDKGLTVTVTDKIFEDLKPQLTHLLQQIQNKPQVNDSFLHQHFDKESQWKFGLEILKRMGYDFEAGRQDVSEHPFTTSFNNADVRVTTRIDENDFTNMTWSCIHEGGHALYEQGLPAQQYGLPLGEYCSLSIHESQSRLWENNIGRSLEFWQHNWPLVTSFFKQQLGTISVNEFYRSINKVQPSLIRTEADEITYHFHVMIRYEIEKLLIAGEIAAKDIPAYWNENYKKYLGITVPDDKQGCLQDVHWSHGSFGYFATYSLGSLYAAQMFASINKNDATLQQQIASGNYEVIAKWLKQNVYCFGRKYTSEQLSQQATQYPLNSIHFVTYAYEKYKNIYNF
jgi:carboxypeptidase Taq